MQRIHLIRHGATVANLNDLYCGKSDLPLCPEGEAALRKLLAKGGYPKAEGCRIITSGMQRTEQTLKILYGDVAHEADPAFREMDFGVFELQSYEQLKTREDYQIWTSGDRARNRCPEGESGEDVANRLRPAFDALLKDGRDTIVITHGGIIAAIMSDLFPESTASRYEWQRENGQGWSLTFEDGKPVKSEPLPDQFLNEERTLGRKWAWVSMGFVLAALGAVMLAAYSAMKQVPLQPLFFGLAGVLLVISQVIRFKKLRCPYCAKSVAPLKFFGNPRLACPRCGRIYRYEE